MDPIQVVLRFPGLAKLGYGGIVAACALIPAILATKFCLFLWPIGTLNKYGNYDVSDGQFLLTLGIFAFWFFQACCFFNAMFKEMSK
jgi:hypothetical protein